MKSLCRLSRSFLLPLAFVPGLAVAQLTEPPADPKPDGRYVFKLHGSGVEQSPTKAKEDWRGNVRSLEGKGFVVMA